MDAAISNYLELYKDVYNQFNVERIIAALPDGDALKILGYGGGIGIVSVALAKLGHDVTLVDAAPAAVAAAGQYALQQDAVVRAICATDLEALPEYNFYDVIISKDLIEHVENDRGLLKQFFSKLKSGGTLILTTQNQRCLNYFIEAGVRKLLRPSDRWMGWDRTHLRFYTPRSLSLLCQEAGFCSPKFNSAYIVPYKLLGVVFPSFDPKRDSIFSSADRGLSRLTLFRKLGWNIMVVAQK